MLRPLTGGLLIGDDAGVTLAAGHDPKTMTFARVCPVAPIPGSDVPLTPGRHDAVAGRALAGLGAIWAGRDGVYLAQAGGQWDGSPPPPSPRRPGPAPWPPPTATGSSCNPNQPP